MRRDRPSRPEHPATRRLFIAVPLPEPTSAAVAALVADVRRDVAGADSVRWVRLDDLHITVRFLGGVAEELALPLGRAVDDVAADHRPFAVTISGAGAFPSPARPRVLWLGLVDGADGLARLATSLEPGLERLGWPPDERPFRAHLTLARSDGVKAGAAVASELAARAAEIRLGFEAERLVLFESVTGAGRARYLAVHEARFPSLGADRHRVELGAGDTIAGTNDPARAPRKGALRAT
jgi:2'-5' RNA ligase